VPHNTASGVKPKGAGRKNRAPTCRKINHMLIPAVLRMWSVSRDVGERKNVVRVKVCSRVPF
jgi:hypothetical protein